MQHLADMAILYRDYALGVFSILWTPSGRLFFVYILSAVVCAFFVYKWGKYRTSGPQIEEDHKSFLRFLFPKHVWSHPSAWLDVRYFFFHKLIGHFLLVGLLAGCTAWAFSLVTGGKNLAEMSRIGDASLESSDYLIALAYMVVFFIIADLFAYTAHYLQHKVPVLWEFHKVHHSAEVMHPMSNFREHPIDNLFYSVVLGLGYGAFIGLATSLLGYKPNMPSVFGVPILMFLFNFVGYNLRHSHIWLRWPGVWSKVFPSPAHHHVHHSCHPEHFDKNFAFMFPVWDVIFGTYTMPEDNRQVKFGVAGMKPNEMDTCVKLYFIPFQKAFRRVRRKSSRESEPQQPAE